MKCENEQETDASQRVTEELSSLLPASHRTASDDLAALARDFTSCVDEELDLQRLARIHGCLWVAGRPMPPRPLHYQQLLGRAILITERIDMHLVWTTGRIFIKPIPRFLLEPRFWEEYLRCDQGCDSTGDGEGARCACLARRARALDFLFSYAALISHESDFRIAQKEHLLAPEVQWPAWRTFVQQLLDNKHIYSSIDPRFHYGELRLSRLNKIYYLWKTPLQGYMSRWNQYNSFFRDNFTWLASSTVYIAVVLTAMQVGLATEALQDNATFQSASYGFTVFSILAPLICVGLVMLTFCYLFVNNCIVTVQYKKKRLRDIESQAQPCDESP